MTLLVDYLEDAAQYLRQKKERLVELEAKFRKIYDRDLKREAAEIKVDIRKKTSEINYRLLLNLEEFRALHKYYPELLSAFMEDEYIGKAISKKAWLLDYKQLPPRQAAARLQQLKEWRAQLKDARKFLKKWVGTIKARSLAATYPVMRGNVSGVLEKEEALAAVEKTDKLLLKEGWLVLITDSLIQIPIAKFMTNINQLHYDEIQARQELDRAHGRGTVAETAALRKYQEIVRKREHYERLIEQILLANPAYLKSLKKKKSWLSKERSGNLDRIVERLTPHTIRERSWLNQMKKKVDG